MTSSFVMRISCLALASLSTLSIAPAWKAGDGLYNLATNLFCIVSIHIPPGRRVMADAYDVLAAISGFNPHPAWKAGDGYSRRICCTVFCFNSHPAWKAGDGNSYAQQTKQYCFNSHPAWKAGDGLVIASPVMAQEFQFTSRLEGG